MEENSNSKLITTLTPNVIKTGYILGKPRRNWIEAIIVDAIFIAILFIIPFTSTVRNIILLIIGPSIFYFFYRGIMNRSVIEMLTAEYRFLKNRRVLHLRGPEYVKKKQSLSNYIGGDDEDLIDRIVRSITGKLREIAKNWSEEDSGENN